MVNVTPRPLYPRERDPVPIVEGAGWTQVPLWTCTKNLAPSGIRSPDRPARSESLYWLRGRHHLGRLGLSNIKLQLYIYYGFHNFSRSLGATSKLKASEGSHEATAPLRTDEHYGPTKRFSLPAIWRPGDRELIRHYLLVLSQHDAPTILTWRTASDTTSRRRRECCSASVVVLENRNVPCSCSSRQSSLVLERIFEGACRNWLQVSKKFFRVPMGILKSNIWSWILP